MRWMLLVVELIVAIVLPSNINVVNMAIVAAQRSDFNRFS